jgi:hypothetical protein
MTYSQFLSSTNSQQVKPASHVKVLCNFPTLPSGHYSKIYPTVAICVWFGFSPANSCAIKFNALIIILSHLPTNSWSVFHNELNKQIKATCNQSNKSH